MKLDGQPFTNSDTCHGVSFAGDAPLDMAEITINGRYPEAGWARNRSSHEMVRVQSGSGKLLLREEGELTLEAGEIVHLLPNTWFAWSGYMTILMACSPAFDQNQYEIRGGE